MTIRYRDTMSGSYTSPYETIAKPERGLSALRRPTKNTKDPFVDAGFAYCGNGNYEIEINKSHYLLFTGSKAGRQVKCNGALRPDLSFSMEWDASEIYGALWADAYDIRLFDLRDDGSEL